MWMRLMLKQADLGTDKDYWIYARAEAEPRPMPQLERWKAERAENKKIQSVET